VNYDLSEFKISIKSLSKQQLTSKEIKGSNIYDAYNYINSDTKLEEINKILHKKNKNIVATLEFWYYPYGNVGIWYNKNGEPRVRNKVVSFKTPYMVKIDERDLYSVFDCISLEQINSILGDSVAGLGTSYNDDGEITGYNYSWGIKTAFSDKVVKDMEKKYYKYVNFPYFFYDYNKVKRNYRLTVSIKGDNKIEKFSLVYYEKLPR
jgi:hypothetical protein